MTWKFLQYWRGQSDLQNVYKSGECYNKSTEAMELNWTDKDIPPPQKKKNNNNNQKIKKNASRNDSQRFGLTAM